MALTETLRLLITADSAGAVRSIQQVGKTAERELSRAEKSLDRWGNRLTTVGTGLIAFGAVAAVGLNAAARSAGELEQAVGGTEAIFKDASGVIDDFAKTSAESVGLSETAFRNLTTRTGGLLKNLGFSLEEAATQSVKLTQIGADLAATFGGTTAEAVDALGAAFRGEADPAERFGLRLNINTVNARAVAMGLADSTASVTDYGRAQAILALIMEQSADAQGQFARESDTLQGRQQRLQASFEDLKAEIGEGVLPAMETLFSVAKGGIGAFSGLNDATGGALGKFATIGTVASLGVGGLSLLVGQAIRMRDAFGTARDAAGALRTRIQTLGATGTALTALPGILVAVAAGFEMWNEQQQKMNISRMTEEFLAAGDSAEAMRDVMATLVDQGPAELIGTFEQLASTNREAAERFIETAEAAGASGDFIQAMRDKLENVSAAEQQTTSDTEALAESMGGAAEGTQDATSALQSYSDTLKAMTDPQFAMIDAMRDSAAAQAELRDSTAALAEARASGDVEAITEAEERYADAVHGARSSVVDLQVAANTLKDSMAEQGLTAAQVEAEFVALAQQQGFTADEALLMAQAFGVATDEANTLGRTDPNVKVTESGNATTQQRLRRTKEDAFAIPKSRNVAVSATGYGNVADLVDRINNKLAQLRDRSVTVRTNFVTTGQGGSGGIPLGRQHGGPVAGGRLYEVAEQGRAELLEMGGRTYLIPGSSGTVVPASMFAGGGGGPVVVSLHISGNGALYEQVNRGVRNGDIQLEVDGKRVGVRR